MKKVRIKFADYYGTPPECTPAYRILRRHYDIEVVDKDPEYLIDGGLGTEHLRYADAVKIVFIGESYCPDFNQFDYAVGFDHLEFGDRYLRIPLFAFYDEFRELCSRSVSHLQPSLTSSPESFVKRGFCSFVVSNDEGDPMRIEFFRRLSKYKPVASGGKLFNNVGGRVADKNAFLSEYKFNIAFENSCVPGYTTEKVMQPLLAKSVPVYYGNPRVEEDFDPGCMIRISGRDDVERAVEEIVALDRDDGAYLEKLAKPSFVHPVEWYEKRLEDFLTNIFDRPLSEARRLNAYGYQVNIRRRAKRMQAMYDWTTPARIVKRIRGAL